MLVKIVFRNIVAALSLGLFLVGCSIPNHKTEEAESTPPPTESSKPVDESKIAPKVDSDLLGHSTNDATEPQKPVSTIDSSVSASEKQKKGDNIYFAFGKTEIDEQDKELLRRHATLLIANPRLTLTLAIFIDNQGSRAYNLALSEDWVDSIIGTLRAFGVPRRQIRTVSAGRRKNNDACTTLACQQQNQRVELIYKK